MGIAFRVRILKRNQFIRFYELTESCKSGVVGEFMALGNDGGWPDLLTRLCEGKELSADETEAILTEILAGDADPVQIAAFLVAIKIKGETVEETTGLVRAMLAVAEPLKVPEETIDIVGTGGGKKRQEGALNVSTMACFLAAGAGATVCKHGNRRASSTSGSFDLLDILGINVELTPQELENQIEEHRIGFAFARTFHPAMRFAGPVRAGLGIPTVFNVLGPLSNPGRVQRQIVGATDLNLANRMVKVLQANHSEHTWVVCGHQETDEISLTGNTKVLELHDGQIKEWDLDPRDYGFSLAEDSDLTGGSPEENAKIAVAIFSGEETGPRRDMVLINAAAGLVVGGQAKDLHEGIKLAQQSIDDGKARQKLDAISL